MRCYLLVPAAVVFLGMLVAGDEQKTVINVDAYYESLCGDSIRWIKYKLVPVYEDLKDHLNVSFVPYGKATHRRDEETEAWKFTCQHGEAECQGNKAQACAIHHIKLSEQSSEQQNLMVDLVGCAMSSRYPPTAVPQCAETIGLNADTREGISDCMKGSEANELLASHGDKTWSLNPNLSFVPTIVINGEYSQENQSAALSNFSKLICGLLPENERPTSCSQKN